MPKIPMMRTANQEAAALVDAVLAVIDACHEQVAGGIAAQLIEETDFGPLIRARDDGGPDDTAVVVQRRPRSSRRCMSYRDHPPVAAIGGYRGVRELRGPLAVVAGVAGVGWDEYVVITLADGSVRHGLVLDVNRDVALVQVMEGTSGMDPLGLRTGSAASGCVSGGNRLAGPHLQRPRRTDRRRPAGDGSAAGVGKRRPAEPDAA